MKISVAIASYNGEQYIKEQLDSILEQTVPVDEIVISDDGSKDRTLAIIAEYQDPRIRLITGNPKPGYCGNFEYVLKHTTGDVIFLADQDDIWTPDKVEKHMEVLEADPQIELIVTNATLIDKVGNVLDREGYDINSQFTPHLCGVPTGKLPMEDFLGSCVYCSLANGMRMCFRKSLLSLALPFPSSGVMHDRWIGFCGLRNDSVYYLDEKLVLYRLHDTNTSMRSNLPLRKRLLKMITDAYHTPYDVHNIACSMVSIMPENDSRYVDFRKGIQEIMDDTATMIGAFAQNPFRGTATILELRKYSGFYANFGMKSLMLYMSLLFFGRRYMKTHPRTMQDC